MINDDSNPVSYLNCTSSELILRNYLFEQGATINYICKQKKPESISPKSRLSQESDHNSMNYLFILPIPAFTTITHSNPVLVLSMFTISLELSRLGGRVCLTALRRTVQLGHSLISLEERRRALVTREV